MKQHSYFLSLALVVILGLVQLKPVEAHVRRAEATDSIPEDDGALAPKPDDIESIRGGFPIGREIPWFAFYNDIKNCGGALVHADMVVTTATCIENGARPNFVRIGSLFTNTGGEVVSVEKGIIHPDWTGDVLKGSDIAILKLDRTVTNTVALLNEDPRVPLAGTDLMFLLGNGLINNSTFSASLQGLFLFYAENCFGLVNEYNPIFHICLAASSKEGACAGDGGGPAVLSGTRLLVGLSSFTNNFCESQSVNGYTRISSYASWVKDKICEESASPPSYCDKDEDSSDDKDCSLFQFFGRFATYFGF